MSNLYSTSEHTSPGLPVRSSEAFGASQNASPTSPSAESEEITPTASLNGPQSFTLRDKDEKARQQEGSRHNASKIISQDYEGSNANTPRITPAIQGNHDLDDLPTEEQTTLGSSNSLSEAQNAIDSHLYPFHSHTSQNISNPDTIRNTSMLIEKPSSDESKSSTETLIHGDIGPLSNRTTHTESLDLQIPQTPRKQLYSQGHDNENIKTASSYDDSLAYETLNPKAESKISSRSARQEAFAEHRRRSTSRSSQGRVEKSIEATLAEDAPASNARSRKSSHMLGLFRENTAPVEVRKSSQNAKAVQDAFGDAKLNNSNENFDVANVDQQFNARSMTEPYDRRSDQGSPAPITSSRTKRRKSSESSQSDELRSGPTCASSTPDAICNDGDVENLDTAQKIPQPKPNGRPSRKRLPTRLLEEIREHHNLGTPFHDKFRTSQTKLTGQLPISKIDDTSDEPHISKTGTSTECLAEDGEAMGEEHETEDDDSEKEQISSALYFPHQAPSPDALQDVNINEARAERDAAQENGQPLPEAALSPNDDTKEESGDVDIKFQSHNRSRHLHGDLQQARPSAITDHELVNLMSDTASSASESESESLGYSSQTDDAEITPKASPTSKGLNFHLRYRKARPTTPLGAVELKPYNHQVGGHTTVFRFSKRAVCKQLTSRENRFYELVEKNHPELLKFLPKSVNP